VRELVQDGVEPDAADRVVAEVDASLRAFLGPRGGALPSTLLSAAAAALSGAAFWIVTADTRAEPVFVAIVSIGMAQAALVGAWTALLVAFGARGRRGRWVLLVALAADVAALALGTAGAPPDGADEALVLVEAAFAFGASAWMLTRHRPRFALTVSATGAFTWSRVKQKRSPWT
jgi:hypothetical protein